MLIKVQLFLAFLLAPILGIVFFLITNPPYSNLESSKIVDDYQEVREQYDRMKWHLFERRELINESQLSSHISNDLLRLIQDNAEEELLEYMKQQEQLSLIVEASAGHQQKSEDLIEQLLATMLGEPIGQTYGEQAIVKVYSLEEAGYRGFMAKVRVHHPDAVRMVLANDQVISNGETTSQAAKRTGATLAINAGGFTWKDGKLIPIGTTVVDGEIVTFYDTSLSFIGFNKYGNLVGGQVTSRDQVKEMEVLHGASFRPTLLKDGKKMSIPSTFANTRHPRTLIGHFNNDDLFFMVVDGRRQGWSSGVTLEEAQEKLLQFNIRDAYNLDGGGSSTFYYNGKVLNKPSDGYERRVSTNIVIIP